MIAKDLLVAEFYPSYCFGARPIVYLDIPDLHALKILIIVVYLLCNKN